MFTFGSSLVLLAMAALSQTPENRAASVSQESSLESFYVVSFYGNGWTIIDVQRLSDSDSKVRFIRVRPRPCGGPFRVQEEDHVFEGVSVRQLAGDADICVPEEKLTKEVRRFRSKEYAQETEKWEPYQPGIEAQCGTQKVIHHLLPNFLLDFEKLEDKAPRLAALWRLSQNIEARYMGRESQPYIDSPPDRNLSQQAAIEIRNGDYDLALRDLPERLQENGKTKLSQLIPAPEEATDLKGENVGVVENISQLGLTGDTTIPYPKMALIAHVQGDVVLKVSVNQSIGSVQSLAGISGHPILVQAASDAISAWQFPLPYSGENPLTLTVHFEVRCPPTIDTTTSTSRLQTQRKKKKPKN